MKPFFVTIPHSGEKIPAEATWLQGLPEPILMCDVDRFVDRLYAPTLSELGVASVLAEWHRYVVDLNRFAEDVDADSVQGSKNPSGTFTTGLHWVKTTTDAVLMKQPISRELHEKLVADYFEPFHAAVRANYEKARAAGASQIFQLDAHSMPSRGTKAHRDPGQTRAEIVVSDFNGKSCAARFKDVVIDSYRSAGFQVAYNWPYIGGRVTQQYGLPEKGQHAIQVELRRDLYMDESTKKLVPERAAETGRRIAQALRLIHAAMPLVV